MIVCSVQDANILSSSLKYLSLHLLTVASFYPSGFPIAPEAARFLYYYSSVYLKSFKELFLQRSGEVFHSRKRMQRYSFFQHKPNISTKKLKINAIFSHILTKEDIFAHFITILVAPEPIFASYPTHAKRAEKTTKSTRRYLSTLTTPAAPPRHDPTPIIAKQGATDTIPARPSSPHVPIYNIIMCRYCQKLMN